MKKFSFLQEELKSKKAVIAFGRFQPPHTGHSALIKHIHSFSGDKHIYVSGTQDNKENPFTAKERVSLLQKMHPEYKNSFHAAEGETGTIFRALSHAHKSGYSHVTLVAGPDRKSEYEKILSTYNGKADKKGNIPFHFKSWKVESEAKRVGEGQHNSGISGTKMRNAALSNDTATFRKGLHPNLTDNDMNYMMRTIRDRLKSKESVREEYYTGNLFHVGDIVESVHGLESIISLGSNYVTTVDSTGKIQRRWLNDVTLIQEKINFDQTPKFVDDQISFYGFTTTQLNESIQKHFEGLLKHSKDVTKNIQTLMLLQSTDAMLKEAKNDAVNYQRLRVEFDRSGKYLRNFSLLDEHSDYRKEIENMLITYELVEAKLKSSDTMKAAQIIAKAIDLPDYHKYTSSEDLINAVAAHSRTKKFSVEGWKIVGKMLNTATDVGIKWNKDILPKPTQKAIGLK